MRMNFKISLLFLIPLLIQSCSVESSIVSETQEQSIEYSFELDSVQILDLIEMNLSLTLLKIRVATLSLSVRPTGLSMGIQIVSLMPSLRSMTTKGKNFGLLGLVHPKTILALQLRLMKAEQFGSLATLMVAWKEM